MCLLSVQVVGQLQARIAILEHESCFGMATVEEDSSDEEEDGGEREDIRLPLFTALLS